MDANLSKNDIAWQAIFTEESILETIAQTGYFCISSETINRKREARLMTKFDHQVQLPKPFRDNHLSIQPISRGQYLIGHLSSYYPLPGDKHLPEIQYFELPSHFKTLKSQTISSESAAILCAYLSGMLTDILGEETFFTVFGRMSTGTFSYDILNYKTKQVQTLNVTNSQCEIDGGFEGERQFAILEAKCQSIDDFIIRQLYYPYRLWESKLSGSGKTVVPILLSFSNNIFTFYVFTFTDLYQYNSIQLRSIHRYCLGKYHIERSEITQLWASINAFEDDSHLTFPQANTFVRIIDLLDKLSDHEQPLTTEEIAMNYAFTIRQANYHTSAGIYLGLLERSPGGLGYHLTPKGQEIVQLDPKRKNLALVKAIVSHQIFHTALGDCLARSKQLDQEKLITIMCAKLMNMSPKTLDRRAKTVTAWIDWILQLTSPSQSQQLEIFPKRSSLSP